MPVRQIHPDVMNNRRILQRLVSAPNIRNLYLNTLDKWDAPVSFAALRVSESLFTPCALQVLWDASNILGTTAGEWVYSQLPSLRELRICVDVVSPRIINATGKRLEKLNLFGIEEWLTFLHCLLLVQSLPKLTTLTVSLENQELPPEDHKEATQQKIYAAVSLAVQRLQRFAVSIFNKTITIEDLLVDRGEKNLVHKVWDRTSRLVQDESCYPEAELFDRVELVGQVPCQPATVRRFARVSSLRLDLVADDFKTNGAVQLPEHWLWKVGLRVQRLELVLKRVAIPVFSDTFRRCALDVERATVFTADGECVIGLPTAADCVRHLLPLQHI